MSNALALVTPPERGLSLKEMTEISDVFVKSGFFSDLKSQAQAVVKMMAGAELGLEPFSAMAELHVIQGKITMSAGLLAKKVKQSGKYDYRVTEQSDKICSIDFFQSGQPIGTSTFTIEDARKAQVKNLEKFPRNMLFARAMSNGVRWFCPDVTGSIAAYVEGEVDDAAPRLVQSGNEVIEAEAVAVLDDSYVRRIVELAQATQTNLDPVLKRAGVSHPAQLSQEQADKTIDWLQKKRDAINATKETEAEKEHPGLATYQEAQQSGLDQWACTKETGARALAMNVLTICDEAKAKLGLDDAQIKDELAGLFPDVKSRKELTAAQANQFIAHLRGFIESATKKKVAEDIGI